MLLVWNSCSQQLPGELHNLVGSDDGNGSSSNGWISTERQIYCFTSTRFSIAFFQLASPFFLSLNKANAEKKKKENAIGKVVIKTRTSPKMVCHLVTMTCEQQKLNLQCWPPTSTREMPLVLLLLLLLLHTRTTYFSRKHLNF